MQRGIEKGDFIEHAVFSGNMYGTRYVDWLLTEDNRGRRGLMSGAQDAST